MGSITINTGEIAKSAQLVTLAKSKAPNRFISNEISNISRQLKILQKGGTALTVASIGFMMYRISYDPNYSNREAAYDASTTITSLTLSFMAAASWAGPYGWAAGAIVGLGTGIFFNYVKPCAKF